MLLIQELTSSSSILLRKKDCRQLLLQVLKQELVVCGIFFDIEAPMFAKWSHHLSTKDSELALIISLLANIEGKMTLLSEHFKSIILSLTMFEKNY